MVVKVAFEIEKALNHRCKMRKEMRTQENCICISLRGN